MGSSCLEFSQVKRVRRSLANIPEKLYIGPVGQNLEKKVSQTELVGNGVSSGKGGKGALRGKKLSRHLILRLKSRHAKRGHGLAYDSV